MSWARTLLDVPPAGGVMGFLDWQAARWPRLESARQALGQVRSRPVLLRDRPIVLQYNPGRTANSTAAVDAAAIAARPCFLCPANLPAEEKGIALTADLVLLANPSPLGAGHAVLAHREHRPQALLPVLEDAVQVAAAGAHGVLFYNGPTCGASAPDHLHLQTLAPEVLPDVAYFTGILDRGALPGERLLETPEFSAWLDPRLRTTVILHGRAPAVAAALTRLLIGLSSGGVESAHNTVLARHRGSVLALVYLRDAHRPACYYAAGPGQRLISPGAVDLAGLLVAVREEDFEALQPGEIEQIFTEVSSPVTLALRETLTRSLRDV